MQSTNVPCSKHRYHSPKANITVKQCSRCLPVVLRKGVNGGKREGERSERESVVPRQNKDSRRVGGHAPPQRHLERSAATMKTRFTGRKQNKRKRILLSSRLNLSSCLNFVPALPERVARRENGLCLLSLRQNKNSSFPGHAPGKDTLRAANAATERGLTGENARANVVSGRALSPVKIKIPVATADMRRHSDTLRGAQRR